MRTSVVLFLAIVAICLWASPSEAVRTAVDEPPFPLFGLILNFGRHQFTCQVPIGYLTGVFTKNVSYPILPTFDLPFPNSGDFVDGIVTLDTDRMIIFTFITSFDKSFNGGWLVGMKLYAGSYEGEYYVDGGLIYAAPVADAALYGIDYDSTTHAIYGWSATEQASGNWDSQFLRINFTNGVTTVMFELKNTVPSTSTYIVNGVHYSLVYDMQNGQITSGTILGIDTSNGEIVYQQAVGIADPILETGPWKYVPMSNTVYTTVYTDGTYLAQIDPLNNFTVAAIGSTPLVDKSESSGTFTVSTKSDLAYVISEGISETKSQVNAWLIVANVTTGEVLEKRNVTSNLSMFITYVPWIDLEH